MHPHSSTMPDLTHVVTTELSKQLTLSTIAQEVAKLLRLASAIARTDTRPARAHEDAAHAKRYAELAVLAMDPEHLATAYGEALADVRTTVDLVAKAVVAYDADHSAAWAIQGAVERLQHGLTVADLPALVIAALERGLRGPVARRCVRCGEPLTTTEHEKCATCRANIHALLEMGARRQA